MNIPTRTFLKKYFPPNTIFSHVGMDRGPHLSETRENYVVRTLPNIVIFNTGLDTPETQDYVNVLIVSLQKLHAYPTQRITAEILHEFYDWFSDNLRDDYQEFVQREGWD